MKALKERILRDGKCFEGGILKVDNFINHQMDPILMKSMAVEFVRRFASTKINKILTIEASGQLSHNVYFSGYNGRIFARASCCLCKEKETQYNGKHAYYYGVFVYKRPFV